MSDDSEMLREIRDLLRLIAEPSIAKRDERLRSLLIEIVGKSRQRAEIVSLMDGVRSQSDLRRASGADKGNLSRMIAAMRENGLIVGDEKSPKLSIPVPSNFFDQQFGEKK